MTSKINADTGEILEYPVRSAFQNFYSAYAARHHVSPQQAKAASCISSCKTGKLGYTLQKCPECGFTKIRARSCNNRNCPCCQAPLEKRWVMGRNSELIQEIAYYHVIFTLPHELNPLIIENQKLLYGLMFSAASGALITLCADRKYMGALPGIVSVLHTWGQKLNFHPHLHVMLSGGGLTRAGEFVRAKHKGFIIPEKVLGSMFRGRFMGGIKELHDSGRLSLTGKASQLEDPETWQKLVDTLYEKNWLPFLKETFNGNGNAVNYLARYAYRTAISNSRIANVSAETVTMSYKDYADQGKRKQMTIQGTEFIRRFLQHVLPPGVHRVRFSGFLANCRKTKSLTAIGKLLNMPYAGNPVKGMKMSELLEKIYGSDICSCPVCSHKLVTAFTIRAPVIP